MSNEPPQIDLQPDEYRERRRGISVHTGQMIASVVIAAGLLTFGFVNRYEIEATTLFGFTAMFAFMGGCAFATLFRRWF